MQKHNCYKVLQITPGASLAEVKTAYRTLVKKYHPDSSGDGASSLMFREIVNAYRTLVTDTQISPAVSPRSNTPGRGATRRPQTAYRFTRTRIFSYLARYGRILLSAKDPASRRNAALILGMAGKSSAYGYLRRGLWDADREVVLAVVRAVAALQIRQAAGELAALFVKTGREVKLAILDFAEVMQQERGFADIIRLGMRDDDPVVRGYVVAGKEG